MLNPTRVEDRPSIESRRSTRALAVAILVVGVLVGSVFAAQSASAAGGPAIASTDAVTSAHSQVATPLAAAVAVQPRLTRVADIAMKATTQRIPYTFGGGHGTTPGNPARGLDCSGFVRWVYAEVGWNIGAGSGESVRRSGAFVKTSHPVPGDLVFFGSSSAYHVGIYISPGTFVDSSHPGSFVGLRKIYPGVMGYYHRKDATAADSQPLRAKVTGSVTVKSATGARIAGGIVTVYSGPSCSQRVTNLRTNSQGRVNLSVLAGRYCVALAAAPHGYRTTAKVPITAKGGIAIGVSIVAPYAPITATIRAVNASTKRGVAGVRVSVYRTNCRTLVLAGTTNSSGNFVTTKAMPGRYCVRLVSARHGVIAPGNAHMVTFPIGKLYIGSLPVYGAA